MMLLFPFPCAAKDVLPARLRRRVSSVVLSLSPTPVNLPAASIHAIRSSHYCFYLTRLCIISFCLLRAVGIQSP
jgi:hypothetical protein